VQGLKSVTTLKTLSKEELMSATAATLSVGNPRAVRGLLVGWLLCGILDISSAVIISLYRHGSPFRMLQYIASGLLGPKSLDGGTATAALGLCLHFFIAFCAATVFFLASRKLGFLTRHPVISGLLYGIAVYIVMYWIVVPLSAIHRHPTSLYQLPLPVTVHMLCVGLPISLSVWRYSR
jgi:hypothetical protein